MNWNEYEEITNGEKTYKDIAELLKKGETVGIGWTDEEYTHLDIVFKYGINKVNGFQRGIKENYLFVSIIDHTSYAFSVSNGIKLGGYIQEKLRMHETTGDKLSELINGIISMLKEG